MDKIEKQKLIIEKLISDGWDIKSVDYTGRSPIAASKRFAEIMITTEECACHGGRMWINDLHTNNHYEISHAAYDESLGIVDSSTELKYIIENEMMDYVNRYSTIVYKLTKINEYGTNYDGTQSEKVEYFSNMEDLAYRILDGEENIKDIYVIDEVKHQYPNEDIYNITKRIKKEAQYSWEESRIWFERTRYERKNKDSEFEKDRSFEMYVEIFNKV